MQLTMTGQIADAPRRNSVTMRPAPSPRAAHDVDFAWLIVLLAAIVLEGALRKWALPDDWQPLAYGAKDVVAALFIIAHPLPHVQTAVKEVRTAAFVVGVVLLPAFILGLAHNPLAAISTYKNAVLWPAFAVHLAPRLSGRVMNRLLPVLAIATCGVAILGAIQFASPMGALVNRYAWHDMGTYVPVAGFGSLTGTRAAGTFSYISGMSEFGVFSFSIALWRSLLPNSHRQKLFAGLTAAAGVCCALESGSRAPVVIFTVMFVGATLVARRVAVFLRIWAVALSIGLAIMFILGPGILAAFVQRWETTDDTIIGRVMGEDVKGNTVDLILANPVGIGLGRTTGYGYFETVQTANQAVSFDDGGSNALLESGLPGLIGLCVITLPLVVVVVRGLRSNRHELRCATALLGVFSAYSVWTGIWYNHTGTAFTWVSIAIWLSCLRGQTRLASRASSRARWLKAASGYARAVARSSP
jgi:hypothetical protein